MENPREELLQELFKEMLLSFRTLRQEHGHGHEHHFDDHTFGRAHLDLFLRLTKEKTGISVKDLAESLNVTSGAISQIVDVFVKKGFVNREEDPSDRRSQIIKLSDRAQGKISKFKETFFEKVSPKFDALTDTEISQLIKLLNKINKTK